MMKQIPSGLNPEEFRAAYRSSLLEYEFRDGEPHCTKCNTPVERGTAYVSVHASEFTKCAGGGQVIKIPIAGCPKCEPDGHSMTTCVHVPLETEPSVAMLLPEEMQAMLAVKHTQLN